MHEDELLKKRLKMNKAYCEDFFQFIKVIKGNTIDFAIDDPPYEIDNDNGKDYKDNKSINWFWLARERYRTLSEKGNWGIWSGYSNVFNILFNILLSSSTYEYINMYELMKKHTFIDIFNKHSDWVLRNWIVLDRQKGRGATYNVVSTREDFLWLAKNEKSTFNKLESNMKKVTGGYGDKNGRENRMLSNVWSDVSPIHPRSAQYKIVADINEGKAYKGQKSVALIERCVKMISNEGEIGHDGFCGSGTFAVACLNTKRNFIVNDIRERAIQITEERIRKMV